MESSDQKDFTSPAGKENTPVSMHTAPVRKGIAVYDVVQKVITLDESASEIFDLPSGKAHTVELLCSQSEGGDARLFEEMLLNTGKDGALRSMRVQLDESVVDCEFFRDPLSSSRCFVRFRQTEDQWHDRLYPRLLHRIQDSVIAVDEHGVIRYWNVGAERIFGFKKEEMEGFHIDKLGPGFDVNHFIQMHKEKVPFVTSEWPFELNGEQRWVRVTVSIISDEFDNFQGVVGVSKDITEVKRLTVSNRRKKNMLETIYNVQNLGVIVVDRNGLVKTINKRAESLMHSISGVHLEKGMPFELIQSSELPAIEEMMDLLESEKEFTLQVPIKVNNEMHWYRIEWFLLMLKEDESDEGVLGMSFTEITRLKQQEISLQESRTRFQRLFEHSELGMTLCDLTGHILEANIALEDILGLNRGESIGKEMDSFVHEDDQQFAQEQLIELVSGRKPNDKAGMHKRYRHKDGSVKHIRLFASLIRDFDGNPDYVVAVLQDITEDVQRKNRIRDLNEKLRLNEARYRKLFDFSRETVVQLDEHGQIIDVTSSIINLLGYTAEELIGLTSYKGRSFLTSDGSVISGFVLENPGVPLMFQTAIKDKSGEVRWLEMNLVNRLDVPEVKAIVANLREVSIERELFLQQKEFLQRLELEKSAMTELHKLKSAFLANMSHEIRTPLNGILGLSNLIQDESKDEGIREYAVLQEQSSRRLLETVNSILEMAKLEAKTAKLSQDRICLSELMKEMIKPFQIQATQKGIELISEIEDLAVYVHFDKGMLNLIVNNLLSNAVKFTKEGQIVVRLYKVDDWPTLVVKDTGIGISLPFQKRVFHPFEQESKGYSRKFEGTGLGLAITKQYVEMNGGKIELCSEQGVGSTFTVTFRNESA